ncbi:MAG: hypothetical protein ABH857_01065, partial [Elusimicrobiota bacterium]
LLVFPYTSSKDGIMEMQNDINIIANYTGADSTKIIFVLDLISKIEKMSLMKKTKPTEFDQTMDLDFDMSFTDTSTQLYYLQDGSVLLMHYPSLNMEIAHYPLFELDAIKKILKNPILSLRLNELEIYDKIINLVFDPAVTPAEVLWAIKYMQNKTSINEKDILQLRRLNSAA